MDIHQQLQENSLSQIKLPRDISNTDIISDAHSASSSPQLGRRLSPLHHVRKSSLQKQSNSHSGEGEATRSNRGRQIGGIKLSVPKLNIKSLNLVSKLKTGKDDASRLLSKVPGTSIFYRKDKVTSDVPDEPKVFTNIETELKPPPIDSSNERKRTFSKDDSALEESFEVAEADLEKEVVLNSCGILATSAKQILESPQYSLDEPEEDQPDEEEEAEPVLAMSKSESDLQTDKTVFDNNGNSTRITEMTTGHKLRKSGSDKLPHGLAQSSEDIWITKTHIADKEKARTSLELNLGQKSVVENSEADKILAKYSRTKKALFHPNMRNSMSDSAIATSQVAVALDDLTDESPKSVLEFDFEVNAELQKKLPNLLQSTRMSRKSQRIYENLKKHIEKQLGDEVCQSTIILI